jgi:hypothetical protein
MHKQAATQTYSSPAPASAADDDTSESEDSLASPSLAGAAGAAGITTATAALQLLCPVPAAPTDRTRTLYDTPSCSPLLMLVLVCFATLLRSTAWLLPSAGAASTS